MKNLIFFILIFTGCSNLKYIFIPPYDGNEYYIITNIRTEAEYLKNNCPNISTDRLVYLSNIFYNYEEQLPYNEDNIKLSLNLNDNIKSLTSFNNKYSKIYCQEKMNIIIEDSKAIQQIVGANR